MLIDPEDPRADQPDWPPFRPATRPGPLPELPAAVRRKPKASTPRPPWCGSCAEATRRLEDPHDGSDLGRCPTCHPKKGTTPIKSNPPTTALPQCDACALRSTSVGLHWVAERRLVLCLDAGPCNTRAANLRPRQSPGQRRPRTRRPAPTAPGPAPTLDTP